MPPPQPDNTSLTYFQSSVISTIECLFPWMHVHLAANATETEIQESSEAPAEEIQPLVKPSPPPPLPQPTSILDDLMCPISHELPLDPVLADDGHIYDRKSIEEWLDHDSSKTSPFTRRSIQNCLTPSTSTLTQIQTAVESVLRSHEYGQPVNENDKQMAIVWKVDKKIQDLTKRAEEGNVNCMQRLGYIYQDGLIDGYTCAVDEAKSYIWFKKGADYGNTRCMAVAGRYLVAFKPDKQLKDQMLGAALLGQAATKEGSDFACLCLGQYLVDGIYGFPKDKMLALYFYKIGLSGECAYQHAASDFIKDSKQRLARLENDVLRPVVATMKRYGLLLTPDIVIPAILKAVFLQCHNGANKKWELLYLAGLQGKPASMERVGTVSYRSGWEGFEKDCHKAFQWNLHATYAGRIKSMGPAGEYLLVSKSKPSLSDQLLGAALLGRAATKNGADFACLTLGGFLAKGKYGFPRDKTLAIRLLKQGNSGECAKRHAAKCVKEKAKETLRQLEEEEQRP